MLKFILIVCIVGYVIYKVGSFFFRAGVASQQLRNFQQQQRNGSVNGSAGASKNRKSTKFSGGEYVDYEEVKK